MYCGKRQTFNDSGNTKNMPVTVSFTWGAWSSQELILSIIKYLPYKDIIDTQVAYSSAK